MIKNMDTLVTQVLSAAEEALLLKKAEAKKQRMLARIDELQKARELVAALESEVEELAREVVKGLDEKSIALLMGGDDGDE